MKAAICYYSRHHGNTRKVLEAMTQGQDVELIDVTARMAVHLEEYDLIGFASGIYFGKFHESVMQFAKQYLPQDKDVFFVCTYGSQGKTASIAEAIQAKNANILGSFGCKGYDTYGPFKLVGGIAKGRPNQMDLDQARAFYQSLVETRG